jgi:hypothetical protein
MPTVASVFGMLIMFFYDDHEPPHFHVHAADFSGKMRLDDLSMIEVSGRMRGRDIQRLRPGRRSTEWSFGRTGSGRGSVVL